MPTIDDIARLTAETVQFLRERSAEEIAALYPIHDFRPCRGSIYLYVANLEGKRVVLCCGMAIVLIHLRDELFPQISNDRLFTIGREIQRSYPEIFSFVRGFDGYQIGEDLAHPSMHAKGITVYRLSIRKRRTA